MRDLIIPKPVIIRLNPVAHLTEYGQRLLRRNGYPPIAGGVGLSAFSEGATLNHLVKEAVYTPAGGYLALCSTTPTVTSTGTTIIEPTAGTWGTFPAYARPTCSGSGFWGAASGSNPASATNSNGTITYVAFGGGSGFSANSWAYCDAVTAGQVIFWGTCPLTVISATQTPAMVVLSALTFQMT